MTDLDEAPAARRDSVEASIENRATNTLNAIMIMLLAAALAAVAAWGIFDFLRSVAAPAPSVTWRQDGVVGFLLPAGLLLTAVPLFQWGWERSRRRSQ